MAKSIAVIGTIANPIVKDYIAKEVSLFINETICFNDIIKTANHYLAAEEAKISAEAVNQYVIDMASTNLNYKYNVGIIADFEMMTVANQNKLLKTIEDSAENTIQILVCKNEQKMINTIKSRVVIIDKRQEELVYDCLDEEREFYEQMIKNQQELNYIQENNEVKSSLYALYRYAGSGDYKRAYIVYTTLFKEYNKLLNQLVLRALYTSLFKQAKYQQLKKLISYEERFFYNLNERLQIESVFVEIIKGEQ